MSSPRVHHCQPDSLLWVELDPDGLAWRLNVDSLGVVVDYCPFCGVRLTASPPPVQGGPGPNGTALLNAGRVLLAMSAANLTPNSIGPNGDGDGMALAFCTAETYADVECFNSGAVVACARRRGSKSEIWDVDMADIAATLDRIRAIVDMAPLADGAQGDDLLHPTGRCTCAGDGVCSWCVDARRREALYNQELVLTASDLSRIPESTLDEIARAIASRRPAAALVARVAASAEVFRQAEAVLRAAAEAPLPLTPDPRSPDRYMRDGNGHTNLRADPPELMAFVRAAVQSAVPMAQALLAVTPPHGDGDGDGDDAGARGDTLRRLTDFIASAAGDPNQLADKVLALEEDVSVASEDEEALEHARRLRESIRRYTYRGAAPQLARAWKSLTAEIRRLMEE